MRFKVDGSSLRSCHHSLLIVAMFAAGLAWENYYTVALAVAYLAFVPIILWELKYKATKVTIVPLAFYMMFFIYVLCYGVILFAVDGMSDRSVFSSIYFPVLLLLSYLLILNNSQLLGLCVALSLMVFIVSGIKLVLMQGDAFNESAAYAQTNWTNLSVASLCFVFLIKNRFVRVLFLVLGSVIVLIGLKRSGILVLLAYWLVYFSFSRESNKKKRSALMGVAYFVLPITLLYFVLSSSRLIDYYQYAIFRMANIAEDGGSGRSRIMEAGFNHWLDSDFFFKIAGLGYRAFEREVGLASSMHNDVGELFLSYGVVGILFLAFIYCRLVYLVLQFYRNKMFELSFCLSILFAFIIYGAVSGIYFYSLFFTSLIVGCSYLEVKWRQERRAMGTRVRVSNP